MGRQGNVAPGQKVGLRKQGYPDLGERRLVTASSLEPFLGSSLGDELRILLQEDF